MPEIKLMTAFGSVPAGSQDGIRRVLHDAIEQIGQEEGSFKAAKAVFTESDEQCVFTVELDGIRKEPNPLLLDLDMIEDAVHELREVEDDGVVDRLAREARPAAPRQHGDVVAIGQIEDGVDVRGRPGSGLDFYTLRQPRGGRATPVTRTRPDCMEVKA